MIDNIIKFWNNLDIQLGTLKSTLQGVSSSTYNLQDTDNKTYRAMEKSWPDAMNNSKKVTDVDIKLTYKNGSSRPSSFNVSYKIDGVFPKIHFKN